MPVRQAAAAAAVGSEHPHPQQHEPQHPRREVGREQHADLQRPAGLVLHRVEDGERAAGQDQADQEHEHALELGPEGAGAAGQLERQPAVGRGVEDGGDQPRRDVRELGVDHVAQHGVQADVGEGGGDDRSRCTRAAGPRAAPSTGSASPHPARSPCLRRARYEPSPPSTSTARSVMGVRPTVAASVLHPFGPSGAPVSAGGRPCCNKLPTIVLRPCRRCRSGAAPRRRHCLRPRGRAMLSSDATAEGR